MTPATGSYIYADVAASPDGTVNVVWWDYSATNAIRGDTCGPAANCARGRPSWGTPQTIATLDATGGTPIPFACPIVAQPGGRASTSPQIDVDRSGGAQPRPRLRHVERPAHGQRHDEVRGRHAARHRRT